MLLHYPIDKLKKFINLYLNIAKESAKMSHAKRLKVGSVIVKNNNIISFSWNGTFPSFDNNCEDTLLDGSLKTKKEVIHAEANAILKVAKSHESCKDSEMIITHSPCEDCAKLIIASGIITVFYEQDYRDTSGLDMLQKANIKVIKISDL